MLSIVLVLSLLTTTMPAEPDVPLTIDRGISVILSEPAGETFTAEEQADALIKLKHAMAWWSDLSPIPLSLHVDQTSFVQGDTQTLDEGSDSIVITIIDNSATRQTFGGAQGLTVSWSGGAYVYLTTSATEAVYAHELGHAVYRLPDFYLIPGACMGIDIMCLTSGQAYTSRFVGCATREALGVPCKRVYLPLMEAP